MRLRGGRCSACSALTSSSVLWAGASRLLRVWCCDGCVAHLNDDARALLTLAAAELEQRHADTSQPSSTPSA